MCHFIQLVLTAAIFASALGFARGDEKFPLDARTMAKWNSAEYVFTGRLDRVDTGPVGRSFPPVYSHTLYFVVDDVMRGEFKRDQRLILSHTARQHQSPRFTQGSRLVVAGSSSSSGPRAEVVEFANKENLTQAKTATSVPIGWSVDDEGKLDSPWADLGESAWKATEKGDDEQFVCSKTGRPSLQVGQGISFNVEPMPPSRKIRWANPDGDGQYRVTVTNLTDQPITVPALLSSKGNILWNESLVIGCQDKAYSVSTSKGVPDRATGTRLQPRQSVSTVINALQLDGPEWPRGGQRVEFQFTLGEKSNTQSFYYASRHHDDLRRQALSRLQR